MNTRALSQLALSTVAAVLLLIAPEARAQLGQPLPDLTPEELFYFQQGKSLFQHDFTPSEGLGPLYNETSCVACHFQGGVGGSESGTARNVIHFGVDHEGRFLDAFEHGGPVVQKNSLASTGNPARGACDLQPDVLPVHSMPGLIQSFRHTPAVFGLGLIDAVPDAVIREYEGKKSWKKPGVAGLANWGVELEGLRPYPGVTLIRPRTVPSGAPRVGRFGWHGATATLFQFSTEPFNIELGISTPFFSRENMPQGQGSLPPECQTLAPGPNDANSRGSVLLYLFQALVAPPPRGPITSEVARGQALFKQVGCADCHRQHLTTASDYYAMWPDGTARRIAALSGKTFEPWSDLLTHDMGPLMDDHRYQGRATGRFWRTTPLWGLRFKTHYLHDGSAATLPDSISAHGGEGSWSRDAYFGLSAEDRAAVHAFLMSL